MNLFSMILITIAAVAVIVWASLKLIEKIFNLIEIYRVNKNPDPARQKHGIVFNKKTGKLEADQATITPF